jgi:hypothetical protein
LLHRWDGLSVFIFIIDTARIEMKAFGHVGQAETPFTPFTAQVIGDKGAFVAALYFACEVIDGMDVDRHSGRCEAALYSLRNAAKKLLFGKGLKIKAQI